MRRLLRATVPAASHVRSHDCPTFLILSALWPHSRIRALRRPYHIVQLVIRVYLRIYRGLNHLIYLGV